MGVTVDVTAPIAGVTVRAGVELSAVGMEVALKVGVDKTGVGVKVDG